MRSVCQRRLPYRECLNKSLLDFSDHEKQKCDTAVVHGLHARDGHVLHNHVLFLASALPACRGSLPRRVRRRNRTGWFRCCLRARYITIRNPGLWSGFVHTSALQNLPFTLRQNPAVLCYRQRLQQGRIELSQIKQTWMFRFPATIQQCARIVWR